MADIEIGEVFAVSSPELLDLIGVRISKKQALWLADSVGTLKADILDMSGVITNIDGFSDECIKIPLSVQKLWRQND